MKCTLKIAHLSKVGLQESLVVRICLPCIMLIKFEANRGAVHLAWLNIAQECNIR